MEIREFAELSPSQRRWTAAIELADGGPASTLDRFARSRYASYCSLFAVVDGVPVARVGSTRPRFRTRREELTICGVADVVTRPDALRRGWATRLLQETHRRARAEGLRWSFLWTHRSWGAHRLYEKLGYRDVYGAPVATRRPTSVPRSSGSDLRARVARGSDGPRIERLLADASRDRVGFARRAPGWYDAMLRGGWRSAEQHRLLYRDRRPIGYVTLSVDRFDVQSWEVVVTDPSAHGPVLDWLGTVAAKRWIGLRATTFLRDAAGEIARRGFDTLPRDHRVMMARSLGPTSEREWDELRASIDDPRFWLQGGDMI